MEKAVQNIPFLRLAIALILGIAAGQYLQLNVIAGSLLLLLLLLGLLILNLKYRYSSAVLFGICFNLFFVALGIIVYNRYNERPVFYSDGVYIATILESPVEKPNSYKSTVKINEVILSDSVARTNEKVIVYFEKSENSIKLRAGDEILFNRSPNPVAPKLNPYDFDYQKYLEQKKIYRQVFLSETNWKSTGANHFSLTIQAEQVRDKLLMIYRNMPIDSTEFEIVAALTLGYKRELDTETRRVFSSSGAMHVLAVSGLHVGIIYWLITMVFGFIRKIKSGRIFFCGITISILWVYAFISGLPPSVLRASLMFSIFVIGETLNRKSAAYNSLAASAFFLLLFNPNNLFDTGFQLSYAAVFGIVYLQPKLEKTIVVKNKFFRYFWSLLTVSVAAQITTFPITTYYFGQFPTFFWLTNIFIIPAVMLLVPLGISVLFFSFIPLISNLLSILLNYCVKLTFLFLSFIEQLPLSVLQVNFNTIQLYLIIFVFALGFIFIANKKALYVIGTLIFFLLFSIAGFVKQITMQTQTQLIVYQNTKNPTVHLINGKDNYVITEEKVLPDELQYSPFSATQKTLGLKTPVMLLASDSIRTKDIFLQNRKILFQGQTICFGKNSNKNTLNTKRDYLINPDPSWLSMNQSDSATVIVTNKRFFSRSHESNTQIYCTFNRGAFRKKW